MTARFSKTAHVLFALLCYEAGLAYAGRKGAVKSAAISVVGPAMGSFNMLDNIDNKLSECESSQQRLIYKQDDFADPKYGAARRIANTTSSLMTLKDNTGLIKAYYGNMLVHYQGDRTYDADVSMIAKSVCALEYIKAIYVGAPWSYIASQSIDMINVFISNTGLAPNPPDLYDPITGTDYPGLGGVGEIQLALDIVENLDYAMMVHEMCHVFTGGYIAAYRGNYRSISESVCEFYVHWFLPDNVVFYDSVKRVLDLRWRNPLGKAVVSGYDESYWMPTPVWAFVARQWGESALSKFIVDGGLKDDAIGPWSSIAAGFSGGDLQQVAGAYLRMILNGELIERQKNNTNGKLTTTYYRFLDKSTTQWAFKPAAPFKSLEAFGFEVFNVGSSCLNTDRTCNVKVVSVPEKTEQDDKRWVCLVAIGSGVRITSSYNNMCRGVNAMSYVAVMHTYEDWDVSNGILPIAYSLRRA